MEDKNSEIGIQSEEKLKKKADYIWKYVEVEYPTWQKLMELKIRKGFARISDAVKEVTEFYFQRE